MYLNEKLKEIVGEPGARAPLKEVDPFSLDSLIAWLEKMPGDGEYDFCDTRECLWAHYALACGYGGNGRDAQSQMFVDWNRANGTSFDPHNLPFPAPGDSEASVANGGLVRDTFGAALSRARALRDAT